MSHDFLPGEICFISNKAEQENSRGFMIGSCLPFAIGRKGDAMSPNYQY